MLRISNRHQRRAPARVSREPKQAVLHRRQRERRFVPAEAGEWHERQCAEERAHAALHKHGVIIRLRLLPHDDVGKADLRRAADALRSEGFIVWHDQRSLMVIGEPTLAITFMDMTAKAGILAPSVHERLKEVLRSAPWLRAKNRPEVLSAVPALLRSIRRVESPV